MLREHRIHRWPYVGLLALVAIMVAGCGGNSEEEDIKEVVEPAILADARDTISPPSPPAYLDARMGELRVEDLQSAGRVSARRRSAPLSACPSS